MQSTLVVQNVMTQLIATTFQKIFSRQVQTKLPHFILSNINSSLNEVGLYSITGNSSIQQFINPIHVIGDHDSIKVDNFTPGDCKTCSKVQQSPKLIQKGYSRYTKTLSMRSQSLQNQKSPKPNKQQNPTKTNKYRVKPTSKSFIKLYTQTQDEIQEFKNEQNLRYELITNRQTIQSASKQLLQAKRKVSERNKNTKNQLNDQKFFTFNYDSTILKSKPKHINPKQYSIQGGTKSISSSKIQSFEQVLELDSVVTKPQLSNNKKKKSINQVSTPEIVQNLSSKKKVPINCAKEKTYHQEVKLNEQRSKSVIQMIDGKANIQKGVVIQEVIDGKIEKLKKDSIKIERKMQQLNRKQFQTSLGKRKFISRVQKSLQQI